jgi:hypothetical protein
VIYNFGLATPTIHAGCSRVLAFSSGLYFIGNNIDFKGLNMLSIGKDTDFSSNGKRFGAKK